MTAAPKIERMADVLCTLPLPSPFAELVGPRASVGVIGRILPTTELAARLRQSQVDVLCPQLRDPVTAELLDAGLPRLRCVALYAVGYNNVDVPAATARGVVVTNTPGVLTNATADCAVGLMLAAARRLCEGDRAMRAGEFTGWAPDYMLGLELDGSLLGVVGFGRIGQAVARRALAFGMRVAYATDVEVTIEDDLRGRVTEMPLGDLLASADVVSLHVPLTETTHHLINETSLQAMKSTAVLVNTSRGPVIDEPALVRALREGWIAAAGLDVYEREPLLAPGLSDCANAVLSPHLGSATTKTRAAMAELTAVNTTAALDGRVPPNCVNPEAWQAGPPPAVP
ncbi:MAG TPA: D-glycerate dehydrogenase [Candidatus Dormibacteraeota bacterium]|nr:D-glycerate dehydrogenase [Candidatus Dormibacteraeota bacterium]